MNTAIEPVTASLKPAKSLTLCAGCMDNFYNGNNPYGVKQCWKFKSSKVCKRLLIPVDLRPPYTHIEPRYVLSCYKRQRYSTVDPKAIGKDGFWKS